MTRQRTGPIPFAPVDALIHLVRVDHHEQFAALLAGPAPMLALAPMQDVTDLPFWKLMAGYGGADVYFTEYFRVHSTSTLEKWILKSITENPTGRPVVAQMIGNDIPSLVRTARELQQYPIAAVDLNLGCPAPVVYRKCAGGGLLRDPARVDSILGALRDAVKIKFTVKTRIGFDSPQVFDELLPIFAKHSLDLLTVHGRTVYEMYRSEVHYDFIARAVAAMPCPVLANGNVHSAQKAEDVLKSTGAHGLMIGRGAIRNPWLFHQIRQRLVVARASRPCDSVAVENSPKPVAHIEPRDRGENRGSVSLSSPKGGEGGGEEALRVRMREFETHGRDARATIFAPRGHDVLVYVRALYEAVCSPDVTESAQVQKMKKYMNYVGVGVDAEGQFLHQIRRVTTQAEFFRVCDEFLNHDRAMPLEPFPLKLKETDLMATE